MFIDFRQFWYNSVEKVLFKDVYWSRFLDLRTFRAGQRLLPRDLTGNRIPAIILSLSRKPGPGVFPKSAICFLTADSRVADERNMDCFSLFRDHHNFYWHELGDQLGN